jgi:hypothetical protein
MFLTGTALVFLLASRILSGLQKKNLFINIDTIAERKRSGMRQKNRSAQYR